MPEPDAPLARVIEQIRSARSNNTPLEIRGGGTKLFYGESATGEHLDLTPLSGISSYEPTELVVTARAGTPLSLLEAVLDEGGQHLPFEPPRFSDHGTVGGMVAAGLSGPARANVGSVRDHLLGVTLLNGCGEILTFGGQVAKNVAGYDVSRLMAGSLGVLGVLCEVSLKVLPHHPATVTLGFDCGEIEAFEQFKRWNSQPLPINASSWHKGRLHVRLSGASAAVNAACDTLGGVKVDAGRAAAWWSAIRDQRNDFFLMSDAQLNEGECLWRVSVAPASAALSLQGEQFVEWNGALRWWRTRSAASQVRDVAAKAGGHATLMRGADKSCGVFSPLSPVLMRVHRGLKHAFDPQGVFNPGRLYAALR